MTPDPCMQRTGAKLRSGSKLPVRAVERRVRGRGYKRR